MVNIGKVANTNFEAFYLKTREIESRVYSDDVAKKLPNLSNNHAQYKEWQLRLKTLNRITNYLSTFKNKRILEVGSGNGWFTNKLNQTENVVLGFDVNRTELTQADELFDGIEFWYHDIQLGLPDIDKVDFIIFNASLQYFKNLKPLFQICTQALNQNGELHILDTQFYNPKSISTAKQNSIRHYKKANVPEMGSYYFHHCLHDLPPHKVLYKPNRIVQKLFSDSPFPWIKIAKSNLN